MYLITGNAENCQSERDEASVANTGMEDTNKLLIVRT